MTEVFSVSYDTHLVDTAAGKIAFSFSTRDKDGGVIEKFQTELHLPLKDRALTAPEEKLVLSFGVCHGTYVFLPFAKAAPVYEIRAGHLSDPQLEYLTQQLEGALAEYYYLADMELRVQLKCCCPAPTTDSMTAPAAQDTRTPTHPPKVIVPFGGGKDSTTLMQLLDKMGCQVQWVYYGEWLGSWADYPKFHHLAAASPCTDVWKAEQHLPCSARLKELNLAPGVEFMDYVAYVSFYTFTAALFALQHGYDYICVGNEYSANAINLVHPKFGYPINHQYEKAFVAEQATHDYLRDHVAPSLHYFSGLQHMSELEIARRFVALCTDKYLHLIISCNWATDDNWCGQCEKCAFVYSMFAAFLEPGMLLSSVWRQSGGDGQLVPPLVGCQDMYDSEAHVHLFEQLMGLSGHKPLECVGTPGEVLAAMYLASQRYQQGATDPRPLPLVLARHSELVATQGRAEWERIQEEISQADAGHVHVPTLYPEWYAKALHG